MTDVPVKDTFEQEAQATKHALEQFLTLDRVYSSPLTRARKLAAYCGYPDAETDDRPRRRLTWHEWEMQLYDEIQDPTCRSGTMVTSTSPTGGESFRQQYQRVAAFLDGLTENHFQEWPSFAHAGVLISAGLHAGIYSWDNAWSNLPDCGEFIVIRN